MLARRFVVSGRMLGARLGIDVDVLRGPPGQLTLSDFGVSRLNVGCEKPGIE
jgi:hypothetical protein